MANAKKIGLILLYCLCGVVAYVLADDLLWLHQIHQDSRIQEAAQQLIMQAQQQRQTPASTTPAAPAPAQPTTPAAPPTKNK